ncbi:MAG: glycosyl hydrolase 53 family protein [Saprospiraceae bacterium]|nr:glycosyl hydrolase 53 family protein [Saprospiraceae bacterium]
MRYIFIFLFVGICSFPNARAQGFYFGADLSYVNEMEDCGVVYKEQGAPKDPYQIFADHQCNLVRLRLWHSPAWYDALNAGNRYSDFQDVRRSIMRAKAAGMQVLLDFHLSDNWADPSKQRVPAAWEGVVNNLPVLKDSLYNYISSTLLALNSEDLLPDMVQIGNETNKGIMLSPAVDAAGWSLDWNRNSQLFKRAIQAVRDVETASGKNIKVALHIAGPAEAGWLMQGFWSNGVTDFDVIGLSYYWAWHQPTTIANTGSIITQLKQLYPGKEVMIFETGYIWTTQSNDNANNIISAVQQGYSPASPDNQRKWLVDLTQEVINKGGSGVIYWEPAWVSSSCWTQWGQGSHQEHAAYFDFNSNLLVGGGMDFMTHTYDNLVAVKTPENLTKMEVWQNSAESLTIQLEGFAGDSSLQLNLMSSNGKIVASRQFKTTGTEKTNFQFVLPSGLPAGVYYLSVYEGKRFGSVKGVVLK